MLQGIHPNAQAMDALMRQQDAQANNLANVNTTGFQRDAVRFRGFEEVLRGRTVTAPRAESSFDRSPGVAQRTDNPLDLALEGTGYFTVETPEGPRYTRNGSFQWDAKGRLVDSGGRPLLGSAGPVRRPKEAKGFLAVDSEGRVTMGEADLGKLKLAHFGPGADLRKRGDSLLELRSGDLLPGRTTVKQGFLESSNVNSVREMAEMMNTLRLFEANQRALQVQGDTLGRAIQDLAR